LGKVQRKNRWELTPNYYNTPQKYPVFDKEKPGYGYRHLIRKKELYQFIDIIPEWEEISNGLNAVVLDSGDSCTLGWHLNGVVGLCAWDRDIYWDDCEDDFYEEHHRIFEKLNIPCHISNGCRIVEFNESSAKAFMLTHVFIHELGHHHDRMTTKSKRSAARGEVYAEAYAKEFEDAIVEEYFKVFRC
jgi:hypothetical protein